MLGAPRRPASAPPLCSNAFGGSGSACTTGGASATGMASGAAAAVAASSAALAADALSSKARSGAWSGEASPQARIQGQGVVAGVEQRRAQAVPTLSGTDLRREKRPHPYTPPGGSPDATRPGLGSHTKSLSMKRLLIIVRVPDCLQPISVAPEGPPVVP